MSKKDIEREYKNLTRDVFKFEISPHMAKMLELDKEMTVKLDDRYYRIIEEDHFTNLLTQQRFTNLLTQQRDEIKREAVEGFAGELMTASNGEPFMKIRNDAKYGDYTDGVRVSMLDNIVENLYFKLTEKGVETYLQSLDKGDKITSNTLTITEEELENASYTSSTIESEGK